MKIKEEIDLEQIELDSICVNESELQHKWFHNFKYLDVGIVFGIVFVKAEIISWYRIQEMFRLQSFHMYGVIGSAVLVGMLSVFLIKKLNIKTIYGEKIILHTKTFNQGQIYGGLLFGLCDYRSLPRPAVCTNRHRFFCNCGYIIKRNSWYLGLWIGKRKIAALKMVLKNMESLKNYA